MIESCNTAKFFVLCNNGEWREIPCIKTSIDVDYTFIPLIEYSDDKMLAAEKELKRAYTDRLNDGMAFGL